MKKETQICFIIDFLFILSCAALLFPTFFILDALWPFLLAYLLSLIFISLSERLEKRFPLKSKWAAVICAVLFYILVSAILWVCFTLVIKDMVALSERLPELLASFAKRFKEYKLPAKIPQYGQNIYSLFFTSLDEIIKKLTEKFVDITGSALKGLPVFLAGFIFTILSSLYISVDFYNIVSFFKNAVPKKFHFFFAAIKGFFKDCLLKILKAYGILMSITFLLLAAGFYILGIKHFIKPALMTSLLDVLPLLGTGCVLIPWSLISFMSGETYLGWGLILLYLTVAVIRNIEEPRLIGRELGLPPLLSFIACFTGLKFMGLKGMIIFPAGFLAFKYIFGKSS